jgi:hypothetical protein
LHSVFFPEESPDPSDILLVGSIKTVVGKCSIPVSTWSLLIWVQATLRVQLVLPDS